MQIATGNKSALPRPGQLDLVDDMTDAADPLGGHMAGVAPTGTGKSLAALSEAAVGAVDYDERWLISTHSVALQTQYLTEDAPVVARAAKEVLGREVKVAVLKGWGQYACVMKALESAAELGVETRAAESRIINVAQRVSKARLAKTVMVDGVEMESSRIQPLVAWALAQHADPELAGDRGSYQGAASDREWDAVSVSTSECLGTDCPLFAICKPMAAREKAAEADIVITNHAMLAVQAATGTPVVIGSNKLGVFNGIIVDEAHTLPGVVRQAGQSMISGGRIAGVIRRVRAVADGHRPIIAKWAQDGHALVDYVDQEICAAIPAGSGETVDIPDDRDPLAQSGDLLIEWLKRGARFANATATKSSSSKTTIAVKRVVTEIDQMVRSAQDVREHWSGTARWLEPARKQMPGEGPQHRQWACVQSAPVQVGKMIERNLWNEITPATDEEEEITRPLSVACMSATLPDGFPRDVGLSAVSRHYASPFDVAYANSLLYIPRAVDAADVEALSATSKWSKKVGFNTGKHADWAARLMETLVAENHGSALVLSSTVSAGKLYAERLRKAARGRWHVYSQWDGESSPIIAAKWRADKTSVLIGTRSLMTGVNAPGETNTLVIVDRAPRSRSNPVDDARVKMLTEAFNGDKWAADRMVYVSDAAVLLDQAVGRLIRSVGDTGLAAVLDPRMLNAGPFKYSAQVRKAYQNAFGRFTVKTSDLNEAVQFLRARRGKR